MSAAISRPAPLPICRPAAVGAPCALCGVHVQLEPLRACCGPCAGLGEPPWVSAHGSPWQEASSFISFMCIGTMQRRPLAGDTGRRIVIGDAMPAKSSEVKATTVQLPTN